MTSQFKCEYDDCGVLFDAYPMMDERPGDTTMCPYHAWKELQYPIEMGYNVTIDTYEEDLDVVFSKCTYHGSARKCVFFSPFKVGQKQRSWSRKCPYHYEKRQHDSRNRANDPKKKFQIGKKDAKRRDIEFHLEFEEVKKMYNRQCDYCGKSPEPLNGIDRIDSNLNYTTDNTCACCTMCNTMKMDASMYDFVKQRIHNSIAISSP